MWWIASTGVGALTYFAIGALSDGEPLLVRAAWAIVAASAVLLIHHSD